MKFGKVRYEGSTSQPIFIGPKLDTRTLRVSPPLTICYDRTIKKLDKFIPYVTSLMLWDRWPHRPFRTAVCYDCTKLAYFAPVISACIDSTASTYGYWAPTLSLLPPKYVLVSEYR